MAETDYSALAVDLSTRAIRERAQGTGADVMRMLAEDFANAVAGGFGPVKWCRTCGRKHPRRSGCDLVEAAVPASSGRMVRRLIHRSRAA